jgi:serine/threonine-protein kinase RsbW
VDADRIDDVRLAVSEACTNLIVHASTDSEYEVRVDLHGSRCSIAVRNSTERFDATALAAATPGAEVMAGGSLAIMKAVMDGVGLESQSQSGTVVKLCKDLSSATARPENHMFAGRLRKRS